MYLLIHHFTIQNLERIQMNTLVERENRIADGGIVGQTEVLLRRTRGRSWMTMPVSEDLQTVLTSVLQSRKLILRREGEVFRRVVDVLFGASCRAWLINLSMISFGIFIA